MRLALLLALLLAPLAQAQDRDELRKRLIKRFDKNGDGVLDAEEKAALRKAAEAWIGKRKKEPAPPQKLTIPKDGTSLHGAAKGPHPVGSIERYDLDRMRLRITYPAGSGTFPLIIWSHGAYGSKDNYRPIVDHWASHGYVVIQPTHSDSMTLGVMPGDKDALRNWAERPKQIGAILTSLDRLVAALPVLTGKIDRHAVGVGGHSFGAQTAQLIGGVRSMRGSHRDKRVRCVLMVSPQGRGGVLGDDRAAWKDLTLPAMVISGDKDNSNRTGKPAKWRREPFDFAPTGKGKWLVWITDATHNFGGIAHDRPTRSGGLNADHVRIVQTATLAYWDAQLKGQAAAVRFLAGDALSKATGMVRVERKPGASDQKDALDEALK